MNLFIFHIHSITPRQSIRYPDIMTKDKHYQLGITVMTLISHNLHTQVIMAWLEKNFIFSKRRRSSDKKDAEVLGNTIPALMCLSGCMSDPLWGFLIQYPHIFLYTNIQSPSPYAMRWVTLNVPLSRRVIIPDLDGTSDKIWCIYLKIIKFYLISIFLN